MEKLAVIAAEGETVRVILEKLEEKKGDIFIVDLTGGRWLKEFSYPGDSFSPGEVGKIIKRLKKEGVKNVVFAGKVDKRAIYQRKKIDLGALKILLSVPDFSDDTLLRAVIDTLKKEGISVLGQKVILSDMIPSEGVLTKAKPSKDQWRDIAFGFQIAKEIGRLGIGQTVVVKARSIVAVEALEGTDSTILRGGELAGEGVVVVKIKRPQQSDLVDIPLVGLETLRTMEKVKAKVLAVEAKETIILDIERVKRMADEKKMVLVAVNESLLSPWLTS